MNRHLASAAAILVLALSGYWFWLTHPDSIATAHSDIVVFHLGLKQVLYASLHAGRGVPFWREDQLGGAPAFTDPQAQFLFPLHFLFWLLPPATALGPTILLQFVVSAFGAYALAGALALPFWSRLFMAAGALFCSKAILAAYAGWLANLSTIALLPFLIAIVIETLERPRLALVGWTAVIGALCLVSGMAQLVYYSLFFLAAMILAARAPRRPVALLSLGALIAGGLAAHLLLPLLSEAHLYSRGQLDYPMFLSGHGRSRQLLTLVWPDALGTPLSDPGVELWEDSAHFGFAAFGLSLVGMAQSGRRRWAATFTALFIVALLLSFDSPMIRFLFVHLPGMDRFRIPSRILFVAALLGLCLAGFGLERLLGVVARRRLAVAVLGATAVVAASLEGAVQVRRYFARPQLAALAPKLSWADFVAKDPAIFRTASILRSSIVPGWAEGLKLSLVTGYNPLTLSHYQRYFELLATGVARPPSYRGNWTDLNRVTRTDLLDALSVRYMVAPLGLPRLVALGTFPAQPIFVFYSGLSARDLAMYRNPGQLPRARWVDSVANVRDEDDAEATLRHTDVRKVAVTIGGGETRQDPPPLPWETVRLEDWAAGALSVATTSDRERFLLISEVWHPGWKASLDGAFVPLLRADLALMGLRVPAGEHIVRLRFTPLHWHLALATSGASVILLLFIFFRAWRCR